MKFAAQVLDLSAAQGPNACEIWVRRGVRGNFSSLWKNQIVSNNAAGSQPLIGLNASNLTNSFFKINRDRMRFFSLVISLIIHSPCCQLRFDPFARFLSSI